MPKISTGMPQPSTWTWAWLGPTLPARIGKPLASTVRSRTEPLVTQPSTPRPRWTVLLTSPHMAPVPGLESRSWMTATVGPSPLTTYSYQPTRRAFFSAAEPTAGWAADDSGAGIAHHRWRVGLGWVHVLGGE